MIKFRVHQGKITEIEVVRETEKCVWVMEKTFKKDEKVEVRNSKISEYESFHDTWEDARQYMVERANVRVSNARRTLDYELAKLGNIKGMKAPSA